MSYVWTKDDTLFPAQDPVSLSSNIYTYSSLVNTTWVHAAPTVVNLANTAILQRTTGNAQAGIVTRTYPLPYTLRQANLLGSFFALGGAIIIQLAVSAPGWAQGAACAPQTALPPAPAARLRARVLHHVHRQGARGLGEAPAAHLGRLDTRVLALLVGVRRALVHPDRLPLRRRLRGLPDLPVRVDGLACNQLPCLDLPSLRMVEVRTRGRGQVEALRMCRLGALVASPPSSSFSYAVSYAFKSHSLAQNAMLVFNILSMILVVGTAGVESVLNRPCAWHFKLQPPAACPFPTHPTPLPQVASFIMSLQSSSCQANAQLLYVFNFSPSFSLGNALMNLAFLSTLPSLQRACIVQNGGKVSGALTPYDAFDMNATGLNLAYMGALTGGYLLVALGIDVFLSHPSIRLWCSRDPKVVDKPYEEDVDVVAERARVKQEIASGHVDDAILVSNLRKVYPGGKVAVKGISFGIGAGEIYGAPAAAEGQLHPAAFHTPLRPQVTSGSTARARRRRSRCSRATSSRRAARPSSPATTS